MFDWIGVKKVQVLPVSLRLTRCLMSDTEATDTTMKCRVGRSEKSLAKDLAQNAKSGLRYPTITAPQGIP